jgi:signal transduction histidine kinase
VIKRAELFFVEAIAPLKDTHRAMRKAKVHSSQVNQTPRQRTAKLTKVYPQLKQEIARRKDVEESLRNSEQRYRRLLEQSRHQQEQLQHLAHQMLSALEEERKEISRELHDEIAQTLTVIHIHLARLKTEATLNAKSLTKKIARTQRLVEKSVDNVHRFARELRPMMLDDLGLIPALHSFMKEFTKRTGIHIHFTTFTTGRIEQLNDAARTVLYRVAQGALTNVARHAHATRVNVSIRKFPSAIRMEIKDDGKGFQVERVLFAKRYQRLGLIGIRERVEMVGGSIAVESAQGKGTTIRTQIPFNNGQYNGKCDLAVGLSAKTSTKAGPVLSV